MSAEAPLLQVRELNLAIGEHSILQAVSFSVAAGGTLGIVGESGSGKSLTAQSIMGLLPDGAHRTGELTLGEHELHALDEPALCRLRGADMSMVFQEPMTALNPVHTIGAQIAESLRLHRGHNARTAEQAAREALDRVGLDNIPATRYPHELSGGQRQRVGIAIAIACKPRLLIADEPTTALDVTTQAEILALLSDLQQETGMALILISHDLAVVADTVDSVMVMRRGEVLDAGEVGAVFSPSSSAYTQSLLRASSWRPASVLTGQSSEALLELKGLRVSYPQGRRLPWRQAPRSLAVDDVGFVIHRGENLGLVGESGSGKSTLARCLLGLMPVDAGELRLRGEAVPLWQRGAGKPGAFSRAVRRHIQIVFQDPYASFNPRHRVQRLVAEPLHLLDTPLTRAEKNRRVDALLERVGLDANDTRHRYPHEFSGGQRQRIAIARALIIEPALLILDEAVSALDVSVRAQVLALLAELANDSGLAYLFISHDLSVVRNVTNRVLIMRHGRLVESGPSNAVFTKPRTEYGQALVKAIPRLPQQEA